MKLRCTCPRNAALASCLLKPGLRLLILQKPLFIETKRGGMVVTAPIDDPCRVLDVKHLVIKDELDKPFRHLRRVERLADCNRFVHAIVMSQNAARTALRP